ncbi:MAG: hypothetical protein V1921_04815 [Candidatus Altiarchaeota archaeon]
MKIEADKAQETAIRISRILKRFHIEHVIIGGVAVSALVQPRSTKDIDFVIREDVPKDVLRKIKNNLRRIGWHFEGENTEYHFKRYLFSKSPLEEEIKNYVELWVGGVCDTLEFDSELWDRSQILDSLPLPRVEDLLATKMLLERSSADLVYHAKSQDMEDIYNIIVNYNSPTFDWTVIKSSLKKWDKSPEMALNELKMIKDKNRTHPNFNLGKIRKAMRMS